MKHSIFIFTILTALVHSAAAQQKTDLTGDWKGYISIHGQHLIIKEHFKKGKNGYSGTTDIPQQGVKGMRLQNITVTKEDSVFFELKAGSGVAKFKGYFKTDSTITGSFHQHGFTFPFKLSRYTPDTTKQAKQNPKPYHHKDIIIQKNDSIQIGGTLTWPAHQKTNQLVIMITGSGEQNRNEEFFGWKIFGNIADYLTRHGIATYRYDDRGMGESTGSFKEAGLHKLSSDAEAIVAYFSKSESHPFHTITLLGHSQGGYIAGYVAARDSLVDKIILMSSPAISLAKIVVYQTEGSPLEKAIFDTLRGSQNFTQIIDTLVKLDLKKYKGASDSSNKSIPHPDKFFHRKENIELKSMGKPFYFSFLDYDPTEDLSKLDIPVLALFGGKDTQVPISLNEAPMVAALDSAGVSYQINVFKNANHLYQHAKTGSFREYVKLPKHFVKGFLPTITDWLKRTEKEK